MTTDQKAYNEQIINEFRSTRSHADGPFPGRPLLLLTTTGAKSGLARTTPLMYLTVDEQIVLVGSNMGAATTPDWCRNLMTNPDVSIEIGKQTYAATATVVTGHERTRLWEAITTQSPFFIEHQAQTAREIPVIRIERREN